MRREDLEALRQAGRVAAIARAFGEGLVVAGARLDDVCQAVEEEVGRRGGHLAFPVQCSINEIAAHYCPPPEDETTLQEGDLAKLDIGVHVDGWVVDTAVTVSLGPDVRNVRLLEAARAALEAAIAVAAPRVEVRRLSNAIESTITSHGFRPMRNLCGHGVGRWVVHAPPAIPNVLNGAMGRLVPGAVVAIEPFATDGLGLVHERGEAEVFRVTAQGERLEEADPEVLDAIAGFRGLPFARRQLRAFPPERIDRTLRALRATIRLQDYRPLAEAEGRQVAQAEHTILVGEEGIEILTR